MKINESFNEVSNIARCLRDFPNRDVSFLQNVLPHAVGPLVGLFHLKICIPCFFVQNLALSFILSLESSLFCARLFHDI